MIFSHLVLLFRKSSLFRLLVFPVIFVLILLVFTVLSSVFYPAPQIYSIDPSGGIPGDIIAIRGNHFGMERDKSWVEIGGDRLSSSAYIKWSNKLILLSLPKTVGEGLVFVHKGSLSSKPLVFTNKINIPETVQINTEEGLPRIDSITNLTTNTGIFKIGELLIIKGKKFGITRNNSKVFFSWLVESAMPSLQSNKTELSSIACSDQNFDYEYWSDQEIRVRVPDGAVTGPVFLQNERGQSNQLSINIVNSIGTKSFKDRRTTVLQEKLTISDIVASDGNMLYLQIPLPEETSAQRNIRLASSEPQAFMDNYKGSILHQIENIKSGQNLSFSHQLIFTSHSIQTKINQVNVKPYTITKTALYQKYVSADYIVPSDDPQIIAKANEIVQKEKNPYIKAKKICTWLSDNIAYEKNSNPDKSVVESLLIQKGDAYDMAILFTALARSAGIPAIPNAGILINASQKTRNHWWAEFWLEDFGWVPVDPALVAGFPSSDSDSIGEKNDWYFGNLDANHVVFTRGWNDLKPMAQKSRIVYRPRFYAFKPVWEESSGNIKSYSSFWEDPKVIGVY